MLSIALNGVIVVAEVVGGLLSGSLALLSDALHNVSDVAALIIALVARRLARRPPSVRHTFGLRRIEVLAALVNSASMLVVVTLIVREAIERLQEPIAIHGQTMLIIGIVGLVGNLISVLLLRRHVHHHDLNTRSAFLHLVQDTLASVVVVVAALLSGWRYGPHLDSAASIIIAVAVLHAGWSLLREAFHILMEAVPRDVDIIALRKDCEQNFAVDGVHHVHVWETGGGDRMMTAHVRLCEQPLSQVEQILEGMRAHLAKRWDIRHVTLEPEIVGCGSDHLVEATGHVEDPGSARTTPASATGG